MSNSVSITQAKIWLFYVQTQFPLYQRLSSNLVREICLYLACHHILPCIQGGTFRLHNFETGEVVTAKVSVSFSKGASFCPYSRDFVLCVGDLQPTARNFDLSVQDAAIANLPDMQVARNWTGIINCGLYVYVFGGNIRPSLKSAEKFDTRRKAWLPVPSMNHERCVFTPTEYHGEIYLIEPCARSYPIEVYSPASDSYREFPVSFKAFSYGVIAFVDGDSIVILQFGGKMHRWRVGSSSLETQAFKWQEQDYAVSVCPPVRVGANVYWISYTSKRLIKYDVESAAVTLANL